MLNIKSVISAEQSKDSVSNLGKQIDSSYKDGKFPEALTLSQNLLNFEPGNAKAQYMLALSLQQMGMRSQAAVELQKYLKSNPDDLNAKIALAQCWTSDGQDFKAFGLNDRSLEFLQKAVELLEKLSNQYPKNPEVAFNLAYAYAQYGDTNAWDTMAKRALALAPDKEDRYKLLIAGQLAHFDYSLAENTANSYLKQFPQKPGPYRVLIEDFYMPQQRTAEAMKLFKQEESLHVFDAANYLSLGEILSTKADQADVIRGAQAFRDAQIWRNLAELNLKGALRLDPNNVHCMLALASVLNREAKVREAAPLVEKALAVVPRDLIAQSLAKKVFPGKSDIAGNIKNMLRAYWAHQNNQESKNSAAK